MYTSVWSVTLLIHSSVLGVEMTCSKDVKFWCGPLPHSLTTLSASGPLELMGWGVERRRRRKEAELILMKKEGLGVQQEEGDPTEKVGWEELSQKGEGPEEGGQGKFEEGTVVCGVTLWRKEWWLRMFRRMPVICKVNFPSLPPYETSVKN